MPRPILPRRAAVYVGADAEASAAAPKTEPSPLWYWILGAGLVGAFFALSDSPEQARARHYQP